MWETKGWAEVGNVIDQGYVIKQSDKRTAANVLGARTSQRIRRHTNRVLSLAENFASAANTTGSIGTDLPIGLAKCKARTYKLGENCASEQYPDLSND